MVVYVVNSFLYYWEIKFIVFEGGKGNMGFSAYFQYGKIVDTPPMDANLRYEQWDLGIDTYFDYSRQKGWLCAIEQCNGSRGLS